MMDKPETRTLWPYAWVAATIAFTVYGQVVLKWQVAKHAALGVEAVGFADKLVNFLGLLLKPWVISAYMAAFMASLAWMMAIKHLAISTAYPFMAMNFVLVIFAGVWFFGEHVSALQIVGISLIILGVALIGYA